MRILGAHVILACRDRSRAEEARKDVCRLSGSRDVEIELIDLASLKSIRESAKRLRDRLSKLDVLINNAGRLMRIDCSRMRKDLVPST